MEKRLWLQHSRLKLKKNKTLGQSSFLKIFLKFKVFGKYKQEENSWIANIFVDMNL